MTRGLIDTSVFIASESGRACDVALLPDEWAVSVVTVAELQAGVLAAPDLRTRAARLATLDMISRFEPMPITSEVAIKWAELRAALAAARRKANVNDMWIAATALANGLPLYSQDDDFAALSGLDVVLV